MTTIALPPALPIEQMVQRFAEMVEAFKQAPTPELLRQLERLGQQIIARSRELGPALALILQRAVAALMGVLTAPATVVVVGTTVGTLALWWLFMEILSEALSHPIDYEGFAERIARAIAIAVEQMTGGRFDLDCYRKLLNRLTAILREYILQGGIIPDPRGLDHQIYNALMEYIKCLYFATGDEELLNPDLIGKFAAMLLRLLQGVGLGILGGLFGAGTAEGGELPPEPTDEEKREVARKLGLHGVSLGNGLASNEVEQSEDDDDCPPDQTAEPADRSEIFIDPATPLDLFSTDDLKKRKKLLESYIKELQDQIDADRRELEELERNPENDSARADLLRLRIEGMNREAERLRKALQNTERECQIRDL
jgi:hypothetical protein